MILVFDLEEFARKKLSPKSAELYASPLSNQFGLEGNKRDPPFPLPRI